MNIKFIFSNLPELETDRLILRKVRLNDAEDLFEYASNPDVCRYVTWKSHKSIEDSILYLKSMIQKYKNKEVGEWGIVNKKDNKFIGTCGYIWWLPKHSRAEIAYALSQKYWNRGLMTEAINEVVRFGFKEMELNRIVARCLVENLASESVLKKIGMKLEGILREHMLIKDSYRDLKLYSILREEYYEKANHKKILDNE